MNVKERSKYLWVGNFLAIDFVNTDIVLGGRAVDLLATPEDLVNWTEAAGYPSLNSVAAPGVAQDSALQEAKAYRALLRTSFAAVAAGTTLPPGLLPQTNAYLGRPENIEKIIEHEGGFRFTNYLQCITRKALMIPVARSMAKLLAEGDLSRLRKCKNAACVLYFYDTTKNGTRTWCSLDLCGNKLRIAASRKRRVLA